MEEIKKKFIEYEQIRGGNKIVNTRRFLNWIFGGKKDGMLRAKASWRCSGKEGKTINFGANKTVYENVDDSNSVITVTSSEDQVHEAEMRDKYNSVSTATTSPVECEMVPPTYTIQEKMDMDLHDLAISQNMEKKSVVKSMMIRFRDVLEAVRRMHMEGVLHLDIKPENILVNLREDVVTKMVLIDFDFAKKESEAKSYAGTVTYADPFVMGDDGQIQYTKASDIYSLGATIYFMMFASWVVEDKGREVYIPDIGIPVLESLLYATLNRDKSQRPTIDVLISMWDEYLMEIDADIEGGDSDKENSPPMKRKRENENSSNPNPTQRHKKTPNPFTSQLEEKPEELYTHHMVGSYVCSKCSSRKPAYIRFNKSDGTYAQFQRATCRDCVAKYRGDILTTEDTEINDEYI